MPGNLQPGSRFRVRFPDQAKRINNLYLDSREDPPCDNLFELTDDGAPFQPEWRDLSGLETFRTAGRLARHVGTRGIVPPVAEPGTYRLCDSTRHACALVVVEAED